MWFSKHPEIQVLRLLSKGKWEPLQRFLETHHRPILPTEALQAIPEDGEEQVYEWVLSYGLSKDELNLNFRRLLQRAEEEGWKAEKQTRLDKNVALFIRKGCGTDNDNQTFQTLSIFTKHKLLQALDAWQKMGLDLTCTNEKGETLFHVAADLFDGDERVVDFLSQYLDPYAPNQEGIRPLDCYYAREELKQRSRYFESLEDPEQLLKLALRFDDLNEIQALFDNYPSLKQTINQIHYDEWGVAELAAYQLCSSNTLKYLRQQGLDFHVEDEYGKTPLMYALIEICNGWPLDIEETYLDFGDCYSWEGERACDFQARYVLKEGVSIFQALQQCGADINYIGTEEEVSGFISGLSLILNFQNSVLLRTYLDMGGTLNQSYSWGIAGRSIVLDFLEAMDETCEEHLKMAEILFEYGFDPFKSDKSGYSLDKNSSIYSLFTKRQRQRLHETLPQAVSMDTSSTRPQRL